MNSISEMMRLGDLFEIDALYAVLRADFNAFHEAITVVLNFYDSYR